MLPAAGPAGVLVLVWAVGMSEAESPRPPIESAGQASQPTSAPGQARRFRDRPVQEQKSRLTTFLVLMLDLLVVIGVTVLVLFAIVRYGRRLRRNRPATPPTELEDLWFLKRDDHDDPGDQPRA